VIVNVGPVTKVVLSLHVLVAILAVGPVAVAASRFPPALRAAAAAPDDAGALATLRVLYRTCRVYALVGIAVPVLGFATAGAMHVTGNTWVLVSIGLTAVAAAVLGLLVLPRQRIALAGIEAMSAIDPGTGRTSRFAPGPPAPLARQGLAMATGAFNLLWVAVTVLMIVRPGSTTGA
jgi:hypothetical protein